MTQNDQEQRIKIFDVPETKLHHDGYTIYKIVFTHQHYSLPENSTSLEVWRRYSAILKFHKEVIKLSHHLQLPECPPPYFKPSIINRFDHETIESRRKCTLYLLKYCEKYPSLYSSEQFKGFFKDDFNMKKKRLSFSRLKEKRNSSSLASSLGLPEGGVSLYAHLDQNSSSSEDLSGKATHNDNIEDLAHIPHRVCEPHSKEKNRASRSNSSLRKDSLVSNHNSSLRNAQDNFSSTPSSFSSKVKNTSAGESTSLRKAKDDAWRSKPTSHPVSEGSFLPKKAVRTKTSEYLQKAEQLIARLSLREAKQGQDNAQSCHNASKEKSARNASFSMKNYRVVGISGKIIIAIDATNEETVAIKVIGKSTEENSKKLILPVAVPFMVPLIRYHETDFAFYLVLKYVSGGKLWNHLKKFIKQPSSSITYPNRGSKSSTTYEGQRLIFEADECSEEMTVQSHIEFDISEVDQRSLSFATDLAVAECKSSVENYSIPRPMDRGHHQSSLSNIIDFPKDSEQLSIDRLSVPSYSQMRRSSSQTKSKSLDDINSSTEEAYEPKSVSIGINHNELWKRNSDKDGNLNLADCRSIGSDTLSGVSDDFSCSSFTPVAELENSEQRMNDRVDSRSVALSSSFSLASAKENSENGAFDVNSLIMNSKKLIEDVNRTLEQSKRQVIRTFSSPKESVSQPSENPIPSAKEMKLATDVKCISIEKTEVTLQSSIHSMQQGASAFPQSDLPTTHTNELNHSHTEPSPTKEVSNSLEFHADCNENSALTPEVCAENQGSLPNQTQRVDGLFESNNNEARCPSPSPIPSKLVSMSSLIENYSSVMVEGLQQIPEGLVRVWVSQVISAMDRLHQQEIVWGDFNPSNILLDEGGGILLTYRSFYGIPKHFVGSSFRTKEEKGYDWLSSLGYLSPELFNPVSIATRSSDWWSVGALLYHLLTGKDLASCHPSGITSHTQINFSTPISEEATSLISNLMCVNPMERLGSSSTGVQEIKDHPFFFGITWPE